MFAFKNVILINADNYITTQLLQILLGVQNMCLGDGRHRQQARTEQEEGALLLGMKMLSTPSPGLQPMSRW